MQQGTVQSLHPIRRQAISAAGLAVIFAAVLASLAQGLISPLGMAAACLPPMLAGLLIAANRNWQGMALVAVGGSLGALLLAGQSGVGGATLLAGLGLLLLGACLLQLRRPWLLPTAVTAAGAFGLLALWQARGVLGPLSLLTGIAAAWLACTIVGLVRSARGLGRGSAWLVAGGSAGALTVAALAVGISAQLCGLAGTLIVLQGLTYTMLPGERRLAGEILLVGGLGLAALGGYLWIGSLGLAAGLGLLTVLLHGLARRSGRDWLDQVALVTTGVQAVVMTLCHPALRQTEAGSWHLWTLLALLTALQLLWQWWTARRRGESDRTVASCLRGLQALYLVACLSTEVGLLTAWPPALTLLWIVAAAALWILGRRAIGSGEAAGEGRCDVSANPARGRSKGAAESTALTVVAGLSAASALLKLLCFDWAQLGNPTRIVLLLVVGTIMLVTPLLVPAQGAPLPAGD